MLNSSRHAISLYSNKSQLFHAIYRNLDPELILLVSMA